MLVRNPVTIRRWTRQRPLYGRTGLASRFVLVAISLCPGIRGNENTIGMRGRGKPQESASGKNRDESEKFERARDGVVHFRPRLLAAPSLAPDNDVYTKRIIRSQ